ncbi:MAG: PQQ-binding-like beta-propeller repeat protein [Bacteroidales bacterium]|nr:PQQ-binding-like beta-propeller repeat protein [Bacteroidales bacterium]
MPDKKIHIIFILVLIAGILSALIYWQGNNPTSSFTISEPGKDKQNPESRKITEIIDIGKFFERFTPNSDELVETWPRFRGESFDNIKKPGIKLQDKLPEKPEILWSVELGEGHAGPAIYKGMVYLLDYDEQLKADMLRCFLLKDGKEVWRRWYPVHVKRNHGMSRTVPAVTDDYVITIGPRCHVMCVNRKTGDFLWGLDIEKEYESEVPLWYTGQCPLIDGNIAVLATGGKSLIIGVDCRTGEKIWETANPNGWKMSHSSIMPFEFNGTKMYVYAAIGGICGIEPSTGKMIWSYEGWKPSVIAPSPVCMPDGKIFQTAGYGAGSVILELKKTGSTFETSVYQEYKPAEGLACEQQTPVFTDGILFGIMPKDGGILRNQFVCFDPADFKTPVWSSGKEKRFGLGPFILADGKFYMLNDDGTLFIVKKSTKNYLQLDEKKLFEGHDAWAPIAIADGYMLLRDSKTMFCINIKA